MTCFYTSLDGSDFVTSLNEKAEMFVINFSSILSLGSTKYILLELAYKQVDLLLDICTTPASVSNVNSCLNSSTAYSLGNIPLLILKKCSSDLLCIPLKLFYKCLSVSCIIV